MGASVLGGSQIFSNDENDLVPAKEAYLLVYPSLEASGESTDEYSWATLGGKLMRECGAEEFSIKGVTSPHSAPYAFVRVNDIDERTSECVIEGAHSLGYSVGLGMKTLEDLSAS